MSSRRRAFVHVGLDDGSGDVVDAALATHAHGLLDLGVRRPTDSDEDLFRGALDLLGTPDAWGYDPRDVAGAWDGVVHRARKGRDTVVLSQPLLASARPRDARRLVESLEPFEVHAVVTVQAPDAWAVPGDPARDLVSVLDRWGAAVGRAERVHVLVGGDRTRTWRSFGSVVGFGTASLRVSPDPDPGRPPLPDVVTAPRAAALRQLAHTWTELLAASPFDVVGDLAALAPDHPVGSPDDLVAAAGHALHDARHELDRLTRRNADLERRLAKVEKKKRKLKRRLSEVS